MKRVHLFEFMDLDWYPQTFRRIQTDYLQFSATLGSGHQNLIPLFERALQCAQTNKIVDLCSGGGGPWIGLQERLKQAGMDVSIQLTDKYPNPEALQKWSAAARQGITYLDDPVDAMQVPPRLEGMRTMFEGFHHFKPESARAILKNAMEHKSAIGVFEASLKQPLGFILLLLAPITTLLAYIVVTPLIKPRTFWRFLWTYLIPLVPLATCWDGVVSMLRVYSPQELEELIAPLQQKGYTWEVGKASTGTPIFDFTYVIGYPLTEQPI